MDKSEIEAIRGLHCQVHCGRSQVQTHAHTAGKSTVRHAAALKSPWILLQMIVGNEFLGHGQVWGKLKLRKMRRCYNLEIDYLPRYMHCICNMFY